MSLRPLTGHPSRAATVTGLCVFAAGWLLVTYAENIDLGGGPVFLLSVLSYIGSGFAAGYVARRSPIMHGVLLSVLLAGAMTLLVVLLPGGSDSYASERLARAGQAIVGLPALFVCCALGAIFGDFVASIRRGDG